MLVTSNTDSCVFNQYYQCETEELTSSCSLISCSEEFTTDSLTPNAETVYYLNAICSGDSSILAGFVEFKIKVCDPESIAVLDPSDIESLYYGQSGGT